MSKYIVFLNDASTIKVYLHVLFSINIFLFTDGVNFMNIQVVLFIYTASGS